MSFQQINDGSTEEAFLLLQKCCGSRRWAEKLLQRRPFKGHEELLTAASKIWFTLETEDWLEAFAAHPKIGDLANLRKKFAETAELCGNEQAGVANANEETLRQLKMFNDSYEKKFGFIFIICAAGKSAGEMLASLQQRIHNQHDVELKQACREQDKITRLRLEKLL